MFHNFLSNELFFSLFLGEIKMLKRHRNNLPFRSFVGCIQANRR